MVDNIFGNEFKNYGIQSPCKDCEKRQIGCHAACRAYQEYKQHHDAVKADAYKKERMNKPNSYIDGTMFKKGIKK